MSIGNFILVKIHHIRQTHTLRNGNSLKQKQTNKQKIKIPDTRGSVLSVCVKKNHRCFVYYMQILEVYIIGFRSYTRVKNVELLPNKRIKRVREREKQRKKNKSTRILNILAILFTPILLVIW